MVVNSIWMRNIFKPKYLCLPFVWVFVGRVTHHLFETKQKHEEFYLMFLGFLLTSDSEVGEALNSGGGISAARSPVVPREEPERSSRGAREELERSSRGARRDGWSVQSPRSRKARPSLARSRPEGRAQFTLRACDRGAQFQ